MAEKMDEATGAEGSADRGRRRTAGFSLGRFLVAAPFATLLILAERRRNRPPR